MTKPTRGGARLNAGAHKKDTKKQPLTVYLPSETILKIPGMKSRFIEAAVLVALENMK